MKWTEQIPDLIMSCGEPAFPEKLDRALNAVAPFALTIMVRYAGPELRPEILHDGLGKRSNPALQAYVDGAYLLDAAYTACTHGLSPGLYRMHDLAPDEFFEGEYCNSPEVHPCISMERGSLAEEIIYFERGRTGAYTAYSLMRSFGGKPFSTEEFSKLKDCAPVVIGLLGRHWRYEGRDTPAHLPKGDEGAVVEAAFRDFGSGTLTEREQTVVSLVLRGHSTVSIAETLGIGEGTVKTHRKSIHQKLSIGSQSQLFALFVSHLLKKRLPRKEQRSE